MPKLLRHCSTCGRPTCKLTEEEPRRSIRAFLNKRARAAKGDAPKLTRALAVWPVIESASRGNTRRRNFISRAAPNSIVSPGPGARHRIATDVRRRSRSLPQSPAPAGLAADAITRALGAVRASAAVVGEDVPNRGRHSTRAMTPGGGVPYRGADRHSNRAENKWPFMRDLSATCITRVAFVASFECLSLETISCNVRAALAGFSPVPASLPRGTTERRAQREARPIPD